MFGSHLHVNDFRRSLVCRYKFVTLKKIENSGIPLSVSYAD